MVGGTSAINAQIYQHCSPDDYALWEANGAKGWGWEDLKPYFRKSELHTPNPTQTLTAVVRTAFFERPPDDVSRIPLTQNRGLEGLLRTSCPPTNVLTAAFVARMLCTSFAGVRTTASTAYLPPSVFNNRPNLSILTNTTVNRVLLAESSDTCIGVEVGQTSGGPRFDIWLEPLGEVIISMGAYGSPQLLQASGIGNKSELEAVGVKSEKELNGVGENLQDHSLVTIVWEAQKGTSLQFLSNPVATVAEGAAFVRSDNLPGGRTSSVAKGESNASGPNAPDIEIVDAPLYYVHHGVEKAPVPNADYLTLAPICLRPKSVGTVKLRSSNMFDAPLIDPQFLSHELDRRAEPLKSLLGKSVSPPNFETLDDEGLLAHLRATAQHIYHPVGTCKIGQELEGGVVDNDLKVHGMKGLRVCDAAVFPSIVSGHPQAAIVAVAEKLSDMIKYSRRMQV
ncbi:hypothetical protein P7C70_g2180, partial [Phenoliferia sp. Uapishka_3]